MLRNNLYRFFIQCTSSPNFFIRSHQMSDAFTNLHFPQIFHAPMCWRPTVVFVGALFRCSSHQYCFCVVKKECAMYTNQA